MAVESLQIAVGSLDIAVASLNWQWCHTNFNT